MQHIKNKDITDLNTFHIKAQASDFFLIENKQELKNLFEQYNISKPLIIGKGSNLLFVQNPKQAVIKLGFDKIKILEKQNDYDIVEVEAGKTWDDFVRWTVENKYYGIVNLSFIPGTLGASPVQNIGAYGYEVSNFIINVEYFDLKDKQFKILNNKQCQFAYRSSIFKKILKNKAIITKVIFRLPKNEYYNLSYKDLKFLQNKPKLNLWLVRLTIGKIRMSKLPDPSIIGNAGSFFKNPIIKQSKFSLLKEQYPNMPYYTLENNMVKIPAGWLIDNLGLKGFRQGQVGTYHNNALVIVNYGQASGSQILSFAQFIQKKVKQAYNINLEPEVNIINN